MVVHYRKQNYTKLKRQAQQRQQQAQQQGDHHFTDPEFPPTAQSLFFSGKSDHDIVWKRPGDICDNPKLIVDGLSSTDLNQGFLGNCWFVAACSSLALERKLWDKVVPHWKEQEWDDNHPERYAGIFHFQFWRLGEWVDVVIDDYLPTKDGELVYMKSKDKGEFWSALLEKAYAKLSGSYEALVGGQTGDALVDFTGGVNEVVEIREGGYSSDDVKMKELFEKLDHVLEHQALVSCSIAVGEGESPETALDCGLIKGHAYCITSTRTLSLSSGLKSLFHREKIDMIRVRNPWGQKEWNGAWSDESEEWNRIPQKEKDKMGLKVEDDGEFWMDFHDWCSWFTDCSICRQVNTRLLSLKKTWHEALFHGEWKGRTAGGCINNRDTFLHNPQYSFTIPREETELMISLMQKDVRGEKGKGGGGLTAERDQAVAMTTGQGGNTFTIGFHFMKVDENRKFRLHAIQEKAGAITFTNRRSVFGRFVLNAGRYVICPSTFDPGLEREFMLRVYSERANHATALKKDIPTRGCLGYLCCCCCGPPHAVVTVHLDGAQGLAKQDFVGAGADPYCIVRCERSKATTAVKKDTLDPAFNSKVVFYPRNPGSAEVKVQVWNSNVLVDRFMGQVTVPIPRDGESERHTTRLLDRGRRSNLETQGTITFRVECSHNLRST